MSTDDFLTEYETALKARAEADVRIAVLEMRLRIDEKAAKSRKKTAIDKFVAGFGEELEQEDIC